MVRPKEVPAVVRLAIVSRAALVLEVGAMEVQAEATASCERVVHVVEDAHELAGVGA